MVGKSTCPGQPGALLSSPVIGPMQDPVTWYGINYAGAQITQGDFQSKETPGWTCKDSLFWKSHYVICVPYTPQEQNSVSVLLTPGDIHEDELNSFISSNVFQEMQGVKTIGLFGFFVRFLLRAATTKFQA